MASARAQEVAEILFELKRAEKISTFTKIARRAGFSPGAGGRTMQTTLKTVRRDWPHLQWWRAFPDDGLIESDSEQSQVVTENGFELAKSDEEDKVMVAAFEEHLMVWEEPEEEGDADA